MFDVCVATLIDDMYVCVMLNKYVEYMALSPAVRRRRATRRRARVLCACVLCPLTASSRLPAAWPHTRCLWGAWLLLSTATGSN